MTFLGSDDSVTNCAKAELGNHYKIMDLGKAKLIVGFEIDHNIDDGTLRLTQKQYIKRVLEQFGMEDSHLVSMPLDPNVKLQKTPDDEKHDIPEYATAVGSLMYTTVSTHPDIAFTI